MGDTIAAMRRPGIWKYPIIGIVALLIALLIYQLPPVNQRLSWRVDFALTYLRGMINPVRPVPTALPQPRVEVTSQPTPTARVMAVAVPYSTPTPGPTATFTPRPTAIPQAVSLASPEWEKQDINNCGPATLALYLRYYGWEGDQEDISQLLKPRREDRNVNVEELIYFVRTRAGWLNAEFRVGGDLELLKELIAAGIPVMIEESFYFDAPYWPNDDLWAAHYLLVTGYDDSQQVFTGQDSFHGANQRVPYQTLDEYWQSFNRVYIMVYPPEKEDTVKIILGDQWDMDTSRQHALEVAQQEIQRDPQNAFAWFNLGSNLAYFERYSEAIEAYNQARDLGLPQRMLRYQFGPFMAYFHGGQLDDLMALIDYALQRTPNSEEALLWRGWGQYRQGKVSAAINDFRQALEENPYYQDAQYALSFASENRSP